MNSIFEMCKQNYGRTWIKEMIAALVVKGKITPEQFEQIVGDGAAEEGQ